MTDREPTLKERIEQVAQLRQRVAELEGAALTQRQTELALHASETRFRRLFEAAKDGILILDATTGEIVAINPFLSTLLGYADQELLGKKLWEIGPFVDTGASKIAFHDLQRQEYIRYDDLSLETRTGRLVSVEFISNVYLADDRTVIQCNIRDITERKRTALHMRLQAAALDAAANAIVLTDQMGTIQWSNPAFSAMTGYTASEALGRNPRDLVKSGHYDQAFYKNLWDTICSGQVWHGEMINRRRDGSLYTEQQTITPLRDASGEISHFVAVKEDVTARVQGVQALRIAEERMRFALEGAHVGIWDLNYTTGVLEASDTLEVHLGRRGTFGKTLDALIECCHPLDRDALQGAIAKASQAGGDFVTENRVVWPDGTVHWLRGIGEVTLGSAGQPVRAVGISLDVTERHVLEAQYEQAQKMEIVGRLAGGVAHDFNNLLTAILGYSELVLADIASDHPHRSDIMEIQAAGTRAAGLTRQLLAFSRKEIIEPTLLDLNAVVTDIQRMLERLIGEDVKIVLDLGAGAAAVKADRGQVEQIIMNLAVNARDAMVLGGTLTIKTANVHLDANSALTSRFVAPGPYVVLSISDTGTGMTPEVLSRLFEPFFTTKGVGKGTGLGLATVHSLVEQCGGRVDVASELGKGSSFTVYFPRVAAAATVAPPRPSSRTPLGAETVLVVDDIAGLRVLTKRLLEREGYRVLLAANVDEALTHAEQNPSIAVVLTDVVMPDTSGPELVRQLRTRRPALKALYMSGYTADAISQHGLLNPDVTFLSKPFTAEALGRKIHELLRS